MPKRKKNPRLPNSWGSIRFLGKGRTLPYAVHPPAKDRNKKGDYIRPAAICYVPDWYTGFAVLSAYHAGTYAPGMEVTISREVDSSSVDLDAFCRRVLKDRGMVMQSSAPTLKEVYDQYIEWKFGEHAQKKLSQSAKDAYKQGWNYLSALKDAPIDTITIDQIQKVVNDCDKKKATRENIVLTAKQLYKFAVSREMCEKNPAQYVIIPDGRDDEHGVPFTEDDLKILWQHKDDDVVRIILIMCYSGFRISAYKSMVIDMTDHYFQGGVKSAASKNRIVPMHSGIIPLVEAAPHPIIVSGARFRHMFADKLKTLGISEHTPHDTRHTFSMLCEKYGVNEADRKRMLGHSFGADVTNAVYGHRTLEELRAEIEKIKICDYLCLVKPKKGEI